MAAPAIKSVTKAALSGFVREHTALSLTQAKALTDQLLAEYIVTLKPPADPSSIPIETGQLWRTVSGRVLRVTEVEAGPIYVPGDPVTSWGPQSVSWEDPGQVLGLPMSGSWQSPDNCPARGTSPIRLWRQQMSLVAGPDQPSTSTATSTPESETTRE